MGFDVRTYAQKKRRKEEGLTGLERKEQVTRSNQGGFDVRSYAAQKSKTDEAKSTLQKIAANLKTKTPEQRQADELWNGYDYNAEAERRRQAGGYTPASTEYRAVDTDTNRMTAQGVSDWEQTLADRKRREDNYVATVADVSSEEEARAAWKKMHPEWYNEDGSPVVNIYGTDLNVNSDRGKDYWELELKRRDAEREATEAAGYADTLRNGEGNSRAELDPVQGQYQLEQLKQQRDEMKNLGYPAERLKAIDEQIAQLESDLEAIEYSRLLLNYSRLAKEAQSDIEGQQNKIAYYNTDEEYNADKAAYAAAEETLRRREDLDPTEAAWQLEQLKAQRDEMFRLYFPDGNSTPAYQDKETAEEYARRRDKIAALDAQIKELEGDVNYRAEQAYFDVNYNSLVNNEDFEKLSRYESTSNGKGLERLIGGQIGETGYDDLLYELINGNQDAWYIHNEQVAGGTGGEAPDNPQYALDTDKYQVYKQMTPEEVAIFNYLRKTDGQRSVEYLNKLEPYLNERNRAAETEYEKEYARMHPVIASISSIAQAPVKGVTLVEQGLDLLDDGKIDQNAPYNKLSYIPAADRAAVSHLIERNWGKPGSFGYQTGMSVLENVYEMALTGGAAGEPFMLAAMGTGAAADAVIAAKDRGLSDGQSFVLGLANGAVEIVTEKIGLDAFYDGLLGGKTALRALLQSTLAEGSEEVASTLLDDIADMIITGMDSERMQRIKELKAQGMSDSEAAGQAFVELLKEAGVSGLAGALSGLFMSGGAQAIMASYNAAASTRETRESNKAIEDLLSYMYENDPNLMTGSEYAAMPNTAPAAVEGTSMPVQETTDTTEAENAAQPVLEPQTEPVAPTVTLELQREAMSGLQSLASTLGENGREAMTSAYDPQGQASISDYEQQFMELYNAAREGRALPEQTPALTPAQQREAYVAGIKDRTGPLQNAAPESTIRTEVTPAKQAQYEALQAADVQTDDFEPITAPEQIMTYQEALQAARDGNQKLMADYDMQDAAEALDAGEITVYSAGPVRTGSFVTPSRMIAESMAGGRRISSMTVPLDSVAWTDATGGQFVETEDINNGTRGDILPRSGERSDGQSAGEQTRQLEGRTGQDQSGNEGRQNAAARSENVRGAESSDRGQVKSTAELGVPDGSTEDTGLSLVEDDSSEETKKVKALAKEMGLELVLFKGGNLHVRGVEARACIIGNKVWVRADHSFYTAEQLLRHENGHRLIDNGEIDPDTVRERIGKASADAVARIYALAYKGSMTAEEAWIEIICDAQGDMNIFAEAGNSNAPTYQRFLDVIKPASENSSGTERGPPAANKNTAPEGGAKYSVEKVKNLIGPENITLQADTNLISENIKSGRSAVDRLIAEAKESDDPESLVEKSAMFRTDLGSIDFRWGKPGEGPKLKKGSGLAHIIEKRNAETGRGVETAYEMVDVIANATQGEVQKSGKPGNNRIRLHYNGRTAILTEQNGSNKWLLTGWEDNNISEAYAAGEGHNSSGATAAAPTFTRYSGVDASDTETNVSQSGESVKTSRELDADYLAAVNSGDMETAQRMVDEAAKEWGAVTDEKGNPLFLYHGTRKFGFTVFDPAKSDDGISLFATESLKMAQTYSGRETIREIGKGSFAENATPSQIVRELKESPMLFDARYFAGNDIDGKHEFAKLISNRLFRYLEERGYFYSSDENSTTVWKAMGEFMGAKGDNQILIAADTFYDAIMRAGLLQRHDIVSDVSLEMAKALNMLRTEQDSYWYLAEPHTRTHALLTIHKNGGYAGNYALYGRSDGLLIVDGKGKNWDEIPINDALSKALFGKTTATTREISHYAKDAGFSGVLIQNITDNGGRGTNAASGNVYIYFDGSSLKSADPVTYDDEGNVIPLSERFNPENEDIRFSSMLDPEALEEQNEQLRKDLEAATAALAKAQSKAAYWEGQTKPSAAPSPDATDINRFARYLVSTNATNLKAKDIAPALTEMAEYIMRGGNAQDELTFTGVKERAVDIAHDILQNYSELQDSTALSDYKEIRKHIRDWGTIRVPGNDLPPDFKDWKAAHRWLRVAVSTGTDIDMVYKDLSTSWPWIFPPDANYGSDQLYAIAEGVRAAEPAYWNPNDEMMAEATEYLANQIIDGLVNGYVDELGETVEMPIRQAHTYADRMEKKLADQKYDAAQKLEEQKAQSQAQLDALRAEKNTRIEQERERARYDMAYAVHQARLAADERLNNLKAHYKEVQETARATKAKAELETRVMKIAKRLQNKKLPTPSRALVNEYAGYIDTEARRLTGKTRNAFKELRSLYYNLVNKKEILPDKRIEKRWERLDQVQVSDLSIEQLQDLCDGLLYIEHELATAKKEIDSKDRRDVYQKGLQIIGDVRGSSTIKGAKVRHNAIVDFLLRYGLDPRRFIRDITGYVDDNPLYLATERINDGQHTMYDYIMRNNASFNKFMDDKDFMKWLTGKDAAEITIVGGNMETGAPVEAKITPDMRISLYLASKNKSNMRHITSIGGGIKVPDIQLYKEGKIKKAFDDGQIIRLTETGVKRICANMSAQELELANEIYKYFNTTSKNALSGVFEKLKGYMMSTVEDYFPINAVKEFIRQLNDDVKHDASIDNPGWLEDRLDNAVGPVMLYDSTSVVLDAIRKHGQFIGLAIPISDFNKLYNMSGPTFNTLGERIGTTGVKDTIQREWGSNTLAYIDKMLADVQNPYTMSDDATKLLRKVRSNYAGATLTMNAGVALKQAGSYPAAAAVLGWEPLVKALGKFGKVNLEAIKESTPLQDLRSQGYSTPEFGDLKNQGRQLPKALNWIQGVDVLTTRKLWKACVIYMQDNHPEMRPGTAEYKETIGKLYNRVIEETQPNYTPMQRPQILRHENDLLRDVFGMFKTQVYQNFGMLYESVGNLAAKQRQYYVNPNEQTKAKYDEAKKSFGRTSSALLVQAIVVSAMTLAWNALRGKLGRYKDKDKEKVTVGSFLKRFGTDVAGNIFGMIPFGSDVFSAISSAWTGDKWYGFEGVTPSALTDFVSAIGSAIDLAGKSYDAAKSGDFAEIQQQSLKWEKAAETGAKFFGVPAENVMNLIKAVYGNITKTACGKYYGEYLSMLATTPIENNKGKYYDLLYNAEKSGHMDQFWEIYNSLVALDAMASEKKSTVENIDAALKQREKKNK